MESTSTHRSTRVSSPRRSRRVGIFAVAALALTFCIASNFAGAAPRVGDVVRDFRSAVDDPAARTTVVERAIAEGPESAARLAREIERELDKEWPKYRARLLALAKPELRSRRARRSEIESLRETVLALRGDASLSKDRIVEEGDPAVERLTELLVVDAGPLVRDSEDLTVQRERIRALGGLWERCDEAAAAKRKIESGECPEPSTFDEVLERQERLATALAMPIDGRDRKTLLANEENAWRIDSGEALGILDLNVLRLLLGIGALRIDTNLCAAARDHSNDMRTHEFFAHTSPIEGKETPSQRASRFRASASSENIARGHRDPATTNLQWFHSPGHHKNMLGNHGRIGLGRSESHWTQLFG